MENQNIRIKYLCHSGFLVETDKHLLVFDLCRGDIDLGDKKTYVFASHAHSDHYNPVIFNLREKRPDIRYILSSDIYEGPDPPPVKGNITSISLYEEKMIDDIKVKAYGSTDTGISFLVECDGKKIFHAGDLNWWYWPGDTPEGIATAEKSFKKEIARIKGEQIDVAFFPVDPRLEQNYCLGAEYFINEIEPRYLIPMHFWNDYGLIRQFSTKMEASSTRVIEITERGQEINL